MTVDVGEISGFVTSVKIRPDREGTYQLKVRLSYNCGVESFEELIPVIEPDGSGNAIFEVRNSGPETPVICYAGGGT